MKVFLRLGACLGPGSQEGGGLSRTRWYCLPVKPPVTLTEEAEEGVIYTVTTRQPGGAQPGAPVGAGSQARSLKAGSLVRLVRHLLEAQMLGDTTYVPAFLVTYRVFAHPPTVLGLLLDRLEEVGALELGPVSPETAELQRAFSSVMCSWLDGYPEDFGGALDPGLVERLGRSLQCALGQGSEAERCLLALRGVQGGPSNGGELEEEEWGVGKDGPEGCVTPRGDPDPLDILIFQADHVAAQLTLVEAALFLRVVPYQCLGSLWSQRDKKGRERDCPSVRATVHQFNRLAGAVIRSCLARPGLRPQQRARILEKWIHVAEVSVGLELNPLGSESSHCVRPPNPNRVPGPQHRAFILEKWIHVAEECRALRNFSSLCAIISALQSSPVHRLKRTWDETARDALRSYEELSTICSEQDNYSLSRQLLFQEGTSKPSGTDPAPRRQLRRPQEQRPVGVVPYLGTFLRDLVMLDTAMKDELENGYINFEKRRKEFEVLAQLRLLQSVCRNYSVQPSPPFQCWLRALPPLSEAQSHSLSCEIEPPGEAPTPQQLLKPTLVITHCTELLSSVGNPLVSWEGPSSHEGPSGCSPDLLPPPRGPTQLLSRLAQHMKWPSVSALDTAPEDVGSSAGGLSPPTPTGGDFPRGHRRSASCGSAFPAPPNPEPGTPSSDCCIIRARMALHNGSLYKSILVTSQDKTLSVIAKVLEKHGQEPGVAPQFELVQLLPEGKELTFPPTANVFYAMNGSSLDFVLRPKSAREPPLPPSAVPRRAELSATFPKIKATGRKLARALF
ncbi:ral guanine nucleotide dissociation stimulator-like 2 isoform X2 [Gopherus flavomarginatus]|uniref:ral guanine nucleotide dissociation stimulator-like 2 isoform X2 n=1 Tax=Gopherus flavomarginatus TaxID=286002 RepID=UPI0021CC2CB9|nr:ral guanine nucleotide dissociation stimulator-like 2 isoform X2 [Gopherus flavomarginatus]